MDILKHRQFGDVVTSYDLVKSLAILLMLIDHIGVFFFPEEPVFRVLGRLCLPVWFFLIGYADSRHIPKSWLVWALVLIGATWLIQGRIFPFNIIVTMILCRLSIDFLAPVFLKNLPAFAAASAIAAALAFPTDIYTDYGTMAIPLVMFGFLLRQDRASFWHALVAYFALLIPQYFMRGFPPFYNVMMAATLPFSFLLCWHFKPERWGGVPRLARIPLQIMGRRTLEIYVLHLVLLRFITSSYFSMVFPA